MVLLLLVVVVVAVKKNSIENVIESDQIKMLLDFNNQTGVFLSAMTRTSPLLTQRQLNVYSLTWLSLEIIMSKSRNMRAQEIHRTPDWSR